MDHSVYPYNAEDLKRWSRPGLGASLRVMLAISPCREYYFLNCSLNERNVYSKTLANLK